MSYIPTIPIRDLTEVTFEDVEYGLNSRKELNRICKDGNINKNKHIILFRTSNGILRVNATVWMVGKKYILLKENLYIPIKSIIEVQ
tara:strand:- start:107 stop:367 length:261 start_codon:yes stop_codon:yes gene_type:complete